MVLSLAVGLSMSAGCANARANVDASGRQVSARSNGDEVNYRIGEVPPDWRRVELPDGPDLAWEIGSTGVLVHVYHACGRSMDSPLPALVQQLLIGFTDREILEEENIPFDGREARRALVRARLDGRTVMVELFVLKKDGCVFDLSCTGSPDRLPAARAAFRAFVDGFHSERTPLSRAAEQR
jgi:hypothetical protein